MTAAEWADAIATEARRILAGHYTADEQARLMRRDADQAADAGAEVRRG